MRFTLTKSFVAITFMAMACAGMTYRTAGWASALISLSLLLYVIMALRALGLRGAQRAFALVFAAVGCGYLLLATSTIFGGIRESLLTNYPLAYAARAIGANNPGGWSAYPMAITPTYSAPSTYTLSTAPPTVPPMDAEPADADESRLRPIPDQGETPVASPPDTIDPYAPAYDSPIVIGSGSLVPSGGEMVRFVPWPSGVPIESLIIEGTASGNSPYHSSPYYIRTMPLQRFFVIGHCAWSWLLALVAGWFAVWVYGRKSMPAVG